MFLLLDTKAFGECFLAWVQAVRKKVPRDIVALDGKTLRASVDEGQPALHLVSAFSTRNRLVLEQRAVDTKSNEITALPELIKVLDLKGCIVTLDSMGCQREIAKRIVAKRADYVLAVKGNQPSLLKAIQGCFQGLDADPGGMTHYATSSTERGHGRVETRKITTISAVAYFPGKQFLEWPKLETLVRVESTTVRGGKTATQTRWYVTTLPPQSVELVASGIRSHWGIENLLHWTLDDETHCVEFQRGREPHPEGQRAGVQRDPSSYRPQPPSPGPCTCGEHQVQAAAGRHVPRLPDGRAPWVPAREFRCGSFLNGSCGGPGVGDDNSEHLRSKHRSKLSVGWIIW